VCRPGALPKRVGGKKHGTEHRDLGRVSRELESGGGGKKWGALMEVSYNYRARGNHRRVIIVKPSRRRQEMRLGGGLSAPKKSEPQQGVRKDKGG